jgi:hypothetical protein
MRDFKEEKNAEKLKGSLSSWLPLTVTKHEPDYEAVS